MNKSQMLQDMLLNEICSGRWKPGDPIPSRNQLCRKYKCSRNTVERAVLALKQRGCLVSNQGGATRVAPGIGRPDAGRPSELFVISGSGHEHSEREIRELFFPDLESEINVKAIRENDLLRHLDTVSRPDAAVIWVTPSVSSLWFMARLEHAQVPQLLINRNYLHYNFAGTDTAASIRKGLEWLRASAGSECVLVSGSADLTMPYLSERIIAFYEAAAALRMTPRSNRIMVTPIHDLPAQVSEIGSRLFASGRTPAGIVILDSRLTVPLVTVGHMYGKTPGRDYFLLTYDFHPELFKYEGIGMLRQQNEKLYLESQRWLREGYAEKRLAFRSSIPAELVTPAQKNRLRA
ncbi:MAG: GntR family transcriptional regulator [Lentisphaeria bacterium]|nr:GntR family transcriptional regulator [Lentisphaeria bacterium]